MKCSVGEEERERGSRKGWSGGPGGFSGLNEVLSMWRLMLEQGCEPTVSILEGQVRRIKLSKVTEQWPPVTKKQKQRAYIFIPCHKSSGQVRADVVRVAQLYNYGMIMKEHRVLGIQIS